MRADLLASLRSEEILWPKWSSKHYIIVEINEPLGEAGDAMEMSLDCWGTEGREVTLVWKYLLPRGGEVGVVRGCGHEGLPGG